MNKNVIIFPLCISILSNPTGLPTHATAIYEAL